jgi:predicted PP-loop superfamily ATPase
LLATTTIVEHIKRISNIIRVQRLLRELRAGRLRRTPRA